ncbi:MAG: diguanylate cyclase [Steroidobacteraceae bacterium]
MSGRRRNDPDQSNDRRSTRERRGSYSSGLAGVRYPSFHEQALQFLTRYLFALLALQFFNFGVDFAPVWLSLWHLNAALLLYLVVNTGAFLHARVRSVSPIRYRLALWVDIGAVTICVANDPNTIPPSMIVYIVVVLGNGMRYGIRFFAEALVATLLGGVLAMTIRYSSSPDMVTSGTLFFGMIGAIIVVYSYILMRRVERSRQSSEQVSRTDPLTGLLNRRGLNEAVDAWLFHRQRTAHEPVIMFADLDNFKAVNDTHGHAEGDRVLIKVATIIRNSLRSDDLVARYGGDEFVVLLADVDLETAELIVQRMQASVDQWFRENDMACGISIGFGTAAMDEKNLERVLQSVDRQLYQSKAQRHIGGLRTVDIRPMQLE